MEMKINEVKKKTPAVEIEDEKDLAAQELSLDDLRLLSGGIPG